MNKARQNSETHSFAIYSHRLKDELFVKKSDQDQISSRARKFASSSWPCSVLIDSG